VSVAFVEDEVVVPKDVGRGDPASVHGDGPRFDAVRIVLGIVGAKFLGEERMGGCKERRASVGPGVGTDIRIPDNKKGGVTGLTYNLNTF